ncbi:MAG: tetratricopeptide repeat protein [Chloroflexota bacterium]
MSEQIEQLIQQAITEARAGNKANARAILSRAVKQEPGNARAWYLLSQMVDKQEQVIYCLEQVLKIQPDNTKARQRLKDIKNPVIDASLADEVSTVAKSPVETTKAGRDIRTPLKRRNIVLGALAGILILCMVCVGAAMLSGDDTDSISVTEMAQNEGTSVAQTLAPKATLEPTKIVIPTDTVAPTATLEPREALQAEVEEVLGSGNRGIPRLTKLTFDDSDNSILVNWAIDDNFTEKLIKYGAKLDATKILRTIAESGIDYSYVILTGSFSMVDKFGNTSEDNVVNLTFYKTTVDRINWDNFLGGDIYSIADYATIWVAFQDD